MAVCPLCENAASDGHHELVAEVIALRREVRGMHMTIQAARGEERQICARMARACGRAWRQGTYPRAGSVEEIAARIAAPIEIPF